MILNLVKGGIFPIKENLTNDSTGFKYPGTFQGEGKLTGTACLFIRTSACNLRCWVDVPGRAKALVCYPDGTYKEVKDVKVGDVILAVDEATRQLVTTEVQHTRTDDNVEWIEFQIAKIGTINVTPEHPFYVVGKGWTEARLIEEGDELEHVGSSERVSYRMTHYNPMKNEETSQKIHTSENYKKSRISSGVRSGQVRRERGISWMSYIDQESIQAIKDRSSKRMKESNPMKNPESVIKNQQNQPKRHSKRSTYEEKVIRVLEQIGLSSEVWFTGHGDYFVTNTQTKKVRNPDFKFHGSKKLIEVGIEYIRRPDLNQYRADVETHYNAAGYKVLVLDGKESEEQLGNRILEFYRNGLSVRKKTVRKNLRYYKDSKPAIRSYSSYNIQCAPHANYLVKTKQSSGEALWNHNCSWAGLDGKGSPCDTPYSSHYPEKNRIEIDEIVKVVLENTAEQGIKHIVISGGEPTMQTEALEELLKKLKDLGYHTTVETNATIYSDNISKYTDLVSMSPKLAASTPHEANLKGTGILYSPAWAEKHERLRINIPVIQAYIDGSKKNSTDFQLKFVVAADTDIAEIEQILKQVSGWEPSDICLMPEGVDVDTLTSRTGWIAEQALRRGWRFAPRLHVMMFGKNRYV